MSSPIDIVIETSSAPFSKLSDRAVQRGALLAARPHYLLVRHSTDPSLCLREPRTPHGREMLPRHYEGWRLTHDLLGLCAPTRCRLETDYIEVERIEGVTLSQWYGRTLSGAGDPPPLPWGTFWSGLERLWTSGRRGPENDTLSPVTLWATWFAIARLREAKHRTLLDAWRSPLWSARAALTLTRGKIAGGYSRPPALAYEIECRSAKGLILGDMHMSNLVGGPGRLAFVDFSEVGHGAVALDLAPLWFEWWLARGLFRGDDGFVEGFSACWRRFVGPERLLVQMTGEWVGRAFEWLIYAFYADHLEIPPPLARGLTTAAARRFAGLRTAFSTANRLSELVTESA